MKEDPQATARLEAELAARDSKPVTLDLNDSLVREMAQRNHVPQETWTIGGTLVSVSCDTCGYEWPCPTRKVLREWDEAAALSRAQYLARKA